MNIRENVPLASATTFEIGGTARYFADARNDADVRTALMWARGKGVPYVLLAGGSNVLVPDEGLEALVIHIASTKWKMSSNILEADAGCILLELITRTNALGYGGWEKLAGIPGTLGGAVRGNAGAFGSEIKDFVTSIRALNAHSLDSREFTPDECGFAYRTSYFKTHPEWIVLGARMQLFRDDSKALSKVAEETIAERERRHIQNVCAAGSYFMNPIAPQEVREMFEKEKGVRSREGRVPAGWLMDKAGMKGSVIGGAQSSPQHADYIVNTGTATARDVKALAKAIKKAVREKFNIELKEEAVVF